MRFPPAAPRATDPLQLSARLVVDRLNAELETDKTPDVGLLDFISSVAPWWQPSRFHLELASVLERVGTRDLRRLIVNTGTQVGKSQLTSIFFPAWDLTLRGRDQIGLVTHTASLSERLSNSARSSYLAYNGVGSVDRSTRAKKRWSTTAGGGIWALGRDGGIVGEGADLLIVDDPVKNQKQALSVAAQQELENLWESTLSQRLRGDGVVVVIMQRWLFDDFSGYLYKRESDSPENWYVVNLPLCYDPEPPGDIPPTCELHPDWRETEGASLWPERYPDEIAAQRIRRAGPWGPAVQQQRPREESTEGRVCPVFTRSLLRPGLKLNPDLELLIGMDFNVNPMSATINQLQGDTFVTLGEVQIVDSNTRQMCQKIREKYPSHPHYAVYPDASSRRRSTASKKVGESDYAILLEEGFDVRARLANPPVRDRVNAANEALRTGKWVIADGTCPHLVTSLMRLQWAPTGTTLSKAGGLDHIFDAATYPVEILFPVVAVEAGEAKFPW